MVQAADGSFYGTTNYGGGGGGGPLCAEGCGTIFQITTGGTLTTIYDFCRLNDCGDGAFPSAELIQGADGEFYGTTNDGGANSIGGTIFKITPAGTLTTLYSFCRLAYCADGEGPYAGLIQTSNGDLYGTTYGGGAHDYGTVFKLTPGGALTTLHSFCSRSGCADGRRPYAGLVQATNGELYGTAQQGGANGYGTIFKITPAGRFTTLYSFCPQPACADGSEPYGGLMQSTNGNFYGTTYVGGANGEGTIFSLSVGLPPFVATQPTTGPVGAAVIILGTDLAGATSVSFNGTATAFEIVSNSEITATVPAGASSGKVQVVTPSDALSSNVPFRVRP